MPQPQPPPEELHTTQRRRAMLASASTQSLLGHHTPDHTAASTEAKRPSDRPSVRRSASGSDTAYYLDADNGVYYDCGIQYSDDHHDASDLSLGITDAESLADALTEQAASE